MSETPPPPPSPGPSRRAPRKGRLVVPAETLLTFSRYTPPRQSSDPNPQFARRPVSNHPRRREAFVQANHRFLVDPTYAPGYESCEALPDALIPWEAVDVVCVQRPLACPICLQNDLRCARVTPCGHIFDYICILQHIEHSADPRGAAKCPLCSSRVVAADLRACSFCDLNVLEIGLPYTMKIVSREKGSMIARLHTDKQDGIPRGIAPPYPLYSRFAFADEVYLLQLLQTAMDDLRAVLREEPALVGFVNEAMAKLREKKGAVEARKISAKKTTSANAESYSKAHFSLEGMPLKTPKELWFFYQAVDTRNVFLHPVNHRCLSVEFGGDFNNAPFEIEGTVLEIERKTMDEQLRKKYRFLEHLPDGCEFAFVELDLSRILSKETLAAKEVELKERKAARRRKEIRIKKEDRQLEKKQTESLQEYFSTQAGRLPRRAPHVKPVDSQDVNNFPALPMEIRNDQPQKHDDGEITEDAGSDFSTPGSAWGGAEVSSYSSVTSNMGLFPSLDQTTRTFPTLGQLPSLPASPNSPSPLQGVWVAGSHATSARNGPSPPEETRRSKRSHGKTTILLSNAGNPNRR